MSTPKIGLLICNSGASNSGALVGAAAMQVIKENQQVGILSLPALINRVPRQTLIAKQIPHIIVIDGCQNSCARKIAKNIGLKFEAYLNLQYDLGIKKLGPFSTLKYSKADIKKVYSEILRKINKIKV